jgi:hypothetical protein
MDFSRSDAAQELCLLRHELLLDEDVFLAEVREPFGAREL